MDHFYINQICTNCWRGNQMFRLDLSLYDADGTIREGIDAMDKYSFICVFCWRATKLDFYSFSHPSMILHLKHIQKLHEQQRDALKKLNVAFHNSNVNSK